MARLSTRQLRSEWAEHECTEKDRATIDLRRGPVHHARLLHIPLEGRVEGDPHDR